MVIDSVKSFERYLSLHQGFDKVYAFIKGNDLYKLAPGEYVIDGKEVWCTISENEGKGFESPQLEVHDNYIDIHILLGGSETIGFKDRGRCNSENAVYDEIKDIAFLPDEPQVYVTMGVDNFLICFPKDAHAPLIGEGQIKKAVFKVKI